MDFEAQWLTTVGIMQGLKDVPFWGLTDG